MRIALVCPISYSAIIIFNYWCPVPSLGYCFFFPCTTCTADFWEGIVRQSEMHRYALLWKRDRKQKSRSLFEKSRSLFENSERDFSVNRLLTKLHNIQFRCFGILPFQCKQCRVFSGLFLSIREEPGAPADERIVKIGQGVLFSC